MFVVHYDKLFWVLDIHIPAFGMASLIPWEKKETCQNSKATGIVKSYCPETTFSYKNYLLCAMSSRVNPYQEQGSWSC